MGARRGLRSLAASTRATQICEKAAQQSPSLLRALLSVVGGRCFPHGPNGPMYIGQWKRAGGAPWEGKLPTGGVGLSPREAPPCRKKTLGPK